MRKALDEEFRDAGFTASARELPRDEIALRLLCAFNGISPEQAPPAWGFYPNPNIRDCWMRVAAEAELLWGRKP